MKQLQELTAFIPAAGYGTRMGDICKNWLNINSTHK